MNPAVWSESLNQSCSEPPPASLNGVLVAGAAREDLAHFNPHTSIFKPSEPVITVAHNDPGRDLIDDRLDINPFSHRMQLSVPCTLTRCCFSVEINGPLLEFSPRGTGQNLGADFNHEHGAI